MVTSSRKAFILTSDGEKAKRGKRRAASTHSLLVGWREYVQSEVAERVRPAAQPERERERERDRVHQGGREREREREGGRVRL